MIRHYGVNQLQNFIRADIKAALELNRKISEDPKFEIIYQPRFALLTFRLRGSNELNKKFVDRLNSSGKLLLTPTQIKNQFIIRWVVSGIIMNGTQKFIDEGWEYAKSEASKILQETEI